MQKAFYIRNSAKLQREKKGRYDTEPEIIRQAKRDSYHAEPEKMRQAQEQAKRDSYHLSLRK